MHSALRSARSPRRRSRTRARATTSPRPCARHPPLHRRPVGAVAEDRRSAQVRSRCAGPRHRRAPARAPASPGCAARRTPPRGSAGSGAAARAGRRTRRAAPGPPAQALGPQPLGVEAREAERPLGHARAEQLHGPAEPRPPGRGTRASTRATTPRASPPPAGSRAAAAAAAAGAARSTGTRRCAPRRSRGRGGAGGPAPRRRTRAAGGSAAARRGRARAAGPTAHDAHAGHLGALAARPTGAGSGRSPRARRRQPLAQLAVPALGPADRVGEQAVVDEADPHRRRRRDSHQRRVSLERTDARRPQPLPWSRGRPSVSATTARSGGWRACTQSPARRCGATSLGRGDYPYRCPVRTPAGIVAPTLHSSHDMFTVNEVFCREDYAAGPALRTVVDMAPTSASARSTS